MLGLVDSDALPVGEGSHTARTSLLLLWLGGRAGARARPLCLSLPPASSPSPAVAAPAEKWGARSYYCPLGSLADGDRAARVPSV